MREPTAADDWNAPSAQTTQAAATELLDGVPSLRAWVAAIAVVWMQVAALVWGLSVLP